MCNGETRHQTFSNGVRRISAFGECFLPVIYDIAFCTRIRHNRDSKSFAGTANVAVKSLAIISEKVDL